MDTTTLIVAALTLVHALVARLALRALARATGPGRQRPRRIATSAPSVNVRWRQLR